MSTETIFMCAVREPRLKDIAEFLKATAARLPECEGGVANARHVDCDCSQHGERVTFGFGSLVIQCRPGARHVRAVAEKYAHVRVRLNPAKPGKPSLRRPADADARLTALEKELAA